jgi:hypothetical protein
LLIAIIAWPGRIPDNPSSICFFMSTVYSPLIFTGIRFNVIIYIYNYYAEKKAFFMGAGCSKVNRKHGDNRKKQKKAAGSLGFGARAEPVGGFGRGMRFHKLAVRGQVAVGDRRLPVPASVVLAVLEH